MIDTTKRDVFVGYPITNAACPGPISDTVERIRRAFRDAGWRVLPERVLSVNTANTDSRELVAQNVRSIARSSLVGLFVDGIVEPSSVWVEAGIAMALEIPCVIVGSADVAVPFLVRSAIGSSPANRLPPWHTVVVEPDVDHVSKREGFAQRIVAEIEAWLNESCWSDGAR